MDRLSNLPDNVVGAVLECLPIRDAVKTSILSKKWQDKWVTVSRLQLNKKIFNSMYRCKKPPSINYVALVKNIMLQHHGPLIKFEIYIPGCENEAEINLIVRYALRNGVRELSVVKACDIPHILPSSLFSAIDQLTHIKLSNCVFNPPLVFKGFPNLKVLQLSSIICPNLDRLSSFISSCQELRRVKLSMLNNIDQHLCVHAKKLEVLYISGRFRSISLDGAQNLVSFFIQLTTFPEGLKTIPHKDYMLHSFGNLRKIKDLTLGGYIYDLLAAEYLPTKLSSGLDHLKKIVARTIDLTRLVDVHPLLCLIRSSPNLQQLKITMDIEDADENEDEDEDEDEEEEAFHLSETQVYEDCSLQHLQTIIINEVTGVKAELKFIEFLLRCSPILETISVITTETLDNHTKLEVVTELTRYCRASPKAQLLFNCD